MEKPNYYSIITADVRYDKSLTPNAKLLYSEISCLTNKNGTCWASNGYFSELYGVSKTTISKWINQLASKNYISVKMIYITGTKQIDKRVIRLAPIKENLNTPIRKTEGGIEENLMGGIVQKFKGNTTSINNTSINNKRDNKPTDLEEVKNYFKLKAFDLSEAINFFEYYESNGWKVGKNPMKKWKLAANRWVRNARPKKGNANGLAAEYFGNQFNTQIPNDKTDNTNLLELK